MAFTPLGTDQTSMNKWVGQRQDIYLTANEASTARLTEQDVLLTNPLDNNAEVAGLAGEYLQGTGAAAVSQVVSSKSTVVQGGARGFGTVGVNEVGIRWKDNALIRGGLTDLSNSYVAKGKE